MYEDCKELTRIENGFLILIL